MTFGRTMICFVAWLAAVATPTLAEPTFTALAARYQEARSDGHAAPRSTEWFFTRNGNRVEIGRGNYVELWERDQRGQVSWRRIFHADRKVVAYTAGQLRTIERELPWETLNTVYDAMQLLAALKKVEETRWLDRPAARYAGKVGNQEVEVVWLEAEQLPARIVRRDQLHTYFQLTLQELRPEPAQGWPRSDLARAADYEEIDGSDLGDREYDPFVQKVLAIDGHSHAH
jgi:hypothetical protein